jgi:hypothetical protein
MNDQENSGSSETLAIPRPGRTRRRLLAIAAVVAVTFVLFRVSQQSRTRNYLDAIRKEGFPASLEELNAWYSLVPFEENAAMKFIAAGDAQVNPQADLLSRLPVIGKVRDIPAANAGLPAEMREVIAAHLADNQSTLDLAHEAASLTRSRYPMDLRQGANTLLPHLSRLKALTQLLKLDALLNSDRHRPDPAVRTTLTSFALAHSLSTEPLMISQLVRVACVALTLSGLERTISENVLTDDQLRALLGKIAEAEADSESSPPRAFAGERCTGISCFGMSPAQLQNLFALGGAGAGGELQAVLFQLAILSGLRDRDLHFYLKNIGEFVQTARLPYPERLEKADQVMARATRDLQRDRLLLFSKMILPSMGGFFTKEANITAQLRAARVALEVERHRLAHGGALPGTLADLTPTYLPAIPADPFDGQPLEFERLPDGYRIISSAATERQNASPGKPLPRASVGFTVTR